MAFLETGVATTATEYESGLATRVHESSIIRDDIYSLIVRLRSKNYEAAKYATQIRAVHEAVGMVAVTFAFLDSNLEPLYETCESMQNGLVTSLEGRRFKDADGSGKLTITQAYFKDYFDDQFGGFLAEHNQCGLVSSASL